MPSVKSKMKRRTAKQNKKMRKTMKGGLFGLFEDSNQQKVEKAKKAYDEAVAKASAEPLNNDLKIAEEAAKKAHDEATLAAAKAESTAPAPVTAPATATASGTAPATAPATASGKPFWQFWSNGGKRRNKKQSKKVK